MRKSIWIGLCFSSLALPAAAADWSGSGELGLAHASGNTQSDTFNGKLAAKRERDQWLVEASASAVYAQGEIKQTRSDGSEQRSTTTSADRYELGSKLGHKLSSQGYVFGAARFEHDRFAAYRWQHVVALGYGYQALRSETTELSFEAGPAWRRVQAVPSGRPVRDDAIGRAAVSFKRKLSANTELSNSLVGESGGANTFTQNELGATVKVSDKLALKAGLQLRRNSAVADGAERTDTLATTNIVFGF